MKRIVLILLVPVMAGMLYRCAKITAPVGGPKDITPPRVLQCVPANHSAHFKGDKFSVTFDEYIQLDKMNQQLLISPPVKDMPDYRLKNKTLIIKFKNPLKPNTTYTVFFGDAIADLNEGNVLKNFSYVFSTGDYVDSLSMRGVVKSALTHEPVDNVTVMLYKNNNDTLSLASLPLYVKPYYVSKTNKNGQFYFSGLADTSYMMFALQDQNYSLTFDQPNENIAFIDSMVKPQYRPAPVLDSALMDTIRLHTAKDSVQYKIDSLVRQADSIADLKLTNYQLYLFSQPDSVLKLLRSGLVKPNVLKFVFTLPPDSLRIQCLNFSPDTTWYLPEWNKERDSLTWYLHQPHPDTLKLMVYNGSKRLDSLDMRVAPKENKFSRRKKKQEEKKKVYLSWKSDLKSGAIKPGDTLHLIFDQPVVKLNLDSALFVQNKDSIYHPRALFTDTIHRILAFPFDVRQGSKYTLFLPDSTIKDWNGLENNDIRLSFKAKTADEYGVITLLISVAQKQHYILQMLDNKGKVLETRLFSSSGSNSFTNLDPGKYSFRIIVDANRNGRWDPGNYFRHLEPEKVIYFPKTINVRANWEIKEDWSVK
ncbi:MAG: Ig-like domain-containing protein [Bacteroidales bacterium]|nr:Ig-like domain-containing protein [Bacteroidales bacterium]